jgi:hypothetical protein
MTVEVMVKPEIRGELDASKLTRLLQVLPVISSTFSRASCLASVSLANKAIYPPLHLHSNGMSPHLASPPKTRRSVTKLESPDGMLKGDSRRGSDVTLDGFLTPPESPPPPRQKKAVIEREVGTNCKDGDESLLNFTMLDDLKALLVESETPDVIEKVEDRASSTPLEEEDPIHISMTVNVKIPEVALNLTYDVSKGRQLLLAVRTLEIQVLSRSHDMQILFDLSELSIQDSLRSEAQRDLARTPRGEKSLIHVSYACMYSPVSPLYRSHATEVVVEFATLGLNFDVNTVMHLRPFMEVLLARKVAPRSSSHVEAKNTLSPVSSISTHGSTNNLFSVASDVDSIIGASSDSDSAVKVMKGMHVFITVSNISLDLLRTPTADTEGAALESAFLLQITDLRADIDIIDLVKADVKLNSFDIIDSRPGSRDYVFRKVFCPVVDIANWRASTSDTNTGTSKSRRKSNSQDKFIDPEFEEHPHKGADKKQRQPDLLHIIYNQITGTISSVNVEVLNVTSFISVDTILDLSYVAMANAFAVLDLISAPPPLPEVHFLVIFIKIILVVCM